MLLRIWCYEIVSTNLKKVINNMSKYYNLNKQESLALGLAVLLSLAIAGAFIWAMIELFSNVIKLTGIY